MYLCTYPLLIWRIEEQLGFFVFRKYGERQKPDLWILLHLIFLTDLASTSYQLSLPAASCWCSDSCFRWFSKEKCLNLWNTRSLSDFQLRDRQTQETWTFRKSQIRHLSFKLDLEIISWKDKLSLSLSLPWWRGECFCCDQEFRSDCEPDLIVDRDVFSDWERR